MTIKGLKPYLTGKKHNYNPKKITLGDIQNSKVAIDGNCLLYKAKSCQQLNTDDLNYNYTIQSYFLRMILNLYKYNIKVIIVFDGDKQCQLKYNECKKRNMRRNKIYCDLLNQRSICLQLTEQRNIIYKNLKKNGIINPTELKKSLIINNNKLYTDINNNKRKFKKLYNLYHLRPTIKEINYLINFLRYLGIIVYKIDKHDGENFCAFLCNMNICDYIISTDSDCMLLSNKPYIYNYSNSSTSYNMIDPLFVKKNILNFTDKEFFNFCILLGTDYNDRMHGNGPVTSYKHIISSTTHGDDEVCSFYDKKLIYDIYYEFNYDEYFLNPICQYFNKNIINILNVNYNDQISKITYRLNNKNIYNYSTDDWKIYKVSSEYLIKYHNIICDVLAL